MQPAPIPFATEFLFLSGPFFRSSSVPLSRKTCEQIWQDSGNLTTSLPFLSRFDFGISASMGFTVTSLFKPRALDKTLNALRNRLFDETVLTRIDDTKGQGAFPANAAWRTNSREATNIVGEYES
jgi:hypothetical protein